MIRCPYELLLCCHRGTCTCFLYIVITEASIWLFQCITPWLQNCVGKKKKNLTATDMTSVSSSSIKDHCTWHYWIQWHTQRRRNHLLLLDWSLFSRKKSMQAERQAARQWQNPSLRNAFSTIPTFQYTKISYGARYHLARIYFATVNYSKTAAFWLLNHDITIQGVNPKSSFAHHNPVKM